MLCFFLIPLSLPPFPSPSNRGYSWQGLCKGVRYHLRSKTDPDTNHSTGVLEQPSKKNKFHSSQNLSGGQELPTYLEGQIPAETWSLTTFQRDHQLRTKVSCSFITYKSVTEFSVQDFISRADLSHLHEYNTK